MPPRYPISWIDLKIESCFIESAVDAKSAAIFKLGREAIASLPGSKEAGYLKGILQGQYASTD